MLTLTVIESEEPKLESGTVYELTDPLPHVMGRSTKAEIRIPDQQASRSHVVFIPSDSGWIIEDLNSRNGTIFNDKELEGKQILSVGDRFLVGGSLFEVSSVGPPQDGGKASAKGDPADALKAARKRKPQSGRKARRKMLSISRRKRPAEEAPDDTDELSTEAVSSGDTHVVNIADLGISLEEDDDEAKGPTPAEIIAEAKTPVGQSAPETKDDAFVDMKDLLGGDTPFDEMDEAFLSDAVKAKAKQSETDEIDTLPEDSSDDLNLVDDDVPEGQKSLDEPVIEPDDGFEMMMEEEDDAAAETDAETDAEANADADDEVTQLEAKEIDSLSKAALDAKEVPETDATDAPDAPDEPDDKDPAKEIEEAIAKWDSDEPESQPAAPVAAAADWDDDEDDFDQDQGEDVDFKALDTEQEDALQTVIGPGTSIRGDLIIEQRLAHIYGDVDGSIQGKGAVHIAEGVVCKSKMNVAQLIVSGTVEGDVRAGRSVTVGANGKIIGNVKAARISVEEGGQIVGRVKIKGARN